MKRIILNVSLLAAGLLAFTSCSNDILTDGEVMVPVEEDGGTRNSGENLEAKTYSQESLLISYNGEALYGKQAKFSVVAPGKASIELSGEALDLSMLTGEDESMLPPVNTCGVFPGTPVFNLDVELSGTEEECTFKGASETEFCTFSYEGSVNAETMSMVLYDVRLKDTSMSGTAEALEGKWGFREYDDNFYNVLRVVWESETQVELFEGVAMPIGSILSMALAYPIVGDAGVAGLLPSLLQDVRFLEDGNVVATYLDAESGQMVTSPKNIAQYVVKGDKIMLYINPQAVIANEMQNTRSEEDMVNAIMETANKLLAVVLPMATEGIPLTYGKAFMLDSSFETVYFDYPETISVYLDTEVLKPMLEAMVPVLSNEEIKQIIIALAISNPDFEMMGSMMGGILDTLPEVIETTSVIEVGINLKRLESSSVPMITAD